ncbi:hypothetical protein BGZ60DRAFT_564753 [Tricladium varicosporioides]|nr:hypothetical protein BGZ60DRAFT_564753 [Hymenoscyphus varicosporioides]
MASREEVSGCASTYSRQALSTRAAPLYFPTQSNQGHTGNILTLNVAESSNGNQRASQVSNRSLSFKSAPVVLPPPSRSNSVAEPCDVCKRTGPKTWTCIQCNNDSFCDDCWSKERAHRPGAVGFDGKPHEKTDRRVVERLRDILEPERTPEQQQELHRGDEDTTWFGIARDSANLPIFQDYERYASIMTQSRTTEVNVRYPQLVSFIGQTGAGKSTLVKMLIDHQENSIEMANPTSRFSSPVTGSINDNIPTSGDVHLYSDPATYYSARPMLYADCEGLDGGENVPRGARYKLRDDAPPQAARSSSARNDPKFRKKIRKASHSSQRDITWATTPETRKREYAVTQLYPRLLYTFSDVVVFVLRNPKVFESVVLEKLLDWASASIEKSLNQPALPHVIIALNATDLQIDEKQWGVREATAILMSDIEGAISRVPRFGEYAHLWREAGRLITTTKDLLECYYSSVTVVRIPTHGRYMLMNEQISKLHSQIQTCCEASYLTKKRVRMLSNDEKLQVYLQSAFDHFSHNLEVPFDFVKEAVKNNPIPRDFGGNILKLAIAVRDHNSFVNHYDGANIFTKLSHMVASCLMLNSARQSLLGSTVQLLEDIYADMCDEALDNFCNMYWPCSFRNANGKCCNMKSGHNPKGHQNSNGRILATGGYESNFHFDDYADEWINNIKVELEKIQQEVHSTMFRHPSWTEPDAAAKIHRRMMNEFYRNVGDVYQFVSHSTCFSCLRELPEHPLPCGHILCTPCVNSYGRQAEKTVMKLDSCPLHAVDTEFVNGFPWKIKIKPLYAGTRILSLDGGGVRGIVELEVLKAIEKALGGDLPIQAFFDLIVGTSTGGIIALGLGVENWTVDQCISKFTSLCGNAFTPRELLHVPLLGKLSTFNHRSMYKTKPFEKALRESFEERPLFGGLNSQKGHMIKVAVTSTTLMDQQPVVLANYNRPDSQEYSSYTFERQDKPAMELKTWEAARATSAAPPYFKDFTKNETKTAYIDGALYHNNPVGVAHHERMLIWKDVGMKQPDIFLSIGTGYNGHPEQDTPVSTSFFGKFNTTHKKELPPRPNVPLGNLRTFSTFTGQLWSTVSSRFDSILNCTKIWNDFRLDALGGPYASDQRRYIRLNPDLGFKVPKLDAVDNLRDIQQAAHEHLQSGFANARTKEVAHRLIASTFFFEKTDASAREQEGKYECDGFICCRFHTGTEEMKALGRYILDCMKGSFEPYFIIQEDRKYENVQKVLISEDVLKDMHIRGRFLIGPIHITLSKQLSTTAIYLCLQEALYPYSRDSNVPISGFPRTLMTEDFTQKPIPRTTVARNRNSGSFKGRLTRRRRQVLQKPTSSGESSTSQSSSLRRVKSQSNLKQGQTEAVFPANPEDVSRWSKRRNSINAMSQPDVYELDDTSSTAAPSDMTIDWDEIPSMRKKKPFRFVI